MNPIGKFCRACLRPEQHRGRGGWYGGTIKKVLRRKPNKQFPLGEIISLTVDTPAFGRIRVWPDEINNQFTGSTCGVLFRNQLVKLE